MMVAQGSSLPIEAFLPRLGRFLKKPWSEKLRSLTVRWVRVMPLPVRLPFGAWWLAEDDWLGRAILCGGLENAERSVVERILQPGMTVLDIGAHHGFYTLLASRKVGAGGRVLAFEPSPRERRKLLRHLRLNRCTNVQVEAHALGSAPGESELFVVVGYETGFNSLRPPDTPEPTQRVRVTVSTLDACLERAKIERVDFVKLDVEGGEMEVLKGAAGLLARRPRPFLLCEVQEIRTRPWGYAARGIIEFLRCRGYRWFAPQLEGSLKPVPADQVEFDGNFLAVPDERMQQVSLGSDT
jgi:FkbM family methyltransferase